MCLQTHADPPQQPLRLYNMKISQTLFLLTFFIPLQLLSTENANTVHPLCSFQFVGGFETGKIENEVHQKWLISEKPGRMEIQKLLMDRNHNVLGIIILHYRGIVCGKNRFHKYHASLMNILHICAYTFETVISINASHCI